MLEGCRLSWGILKPLSDYAFLLMIIVQVLYWIHSFRWDESMINNQAATQLWLQQSNFYAKIGIVLLALAVAFRICYWAIEYIADRRRLMLDEELNGRSTR